MLPPSFPGCRVKLHFRDRPWDLIVALSYTMLVALLVIGLNAGNLLAAPMILLIPGYVLASALLPGSRPSKKPMNDWSERIALSFGLAIAVVPLLGLLVDLSPWGFRLESVVGAIACFNIGTGLVAYWRRMRLPPEMRLSLTLEFRVPSWSGSSASSKGLTLVLLGSIIGATSILGYLALAPSPLQQFTEFHVLGPDGNASGYPTNLTPSQPGVVIIEVVNHEAANVRYYVQVDLAAIRFSFNETTGRNETFAFNRTTLSTYNVTLADGQNWVKRYTFMISSVGLWKLQFLLRGSENFSSLDQELHLFVVVS